MNEIFALGIDRPTLASLAAELGSDTPFFVYDTPQYCTGRGEIMEPVEVNLGGKLLIVAKPQEGVSTAEAYGGVRPKVPQSDLRELVAQPVDRWQEAVVNDFEAHILVSHPRIAQIKQALLDVGAEYAAMSGSGSAVFGIFDQQPALNLSAETFVHIEQID
jgi:4-diphosphocytidyl-2-C-methyl-D-erythritol kinase